MRILITTGIYPPRIGGPAQYAQNLKETLERLGHHVSVSTYKLENFLPTGIRHIFFFFRILLKIAKADFCIALDTFSVGFPSVVAAKLFNKKVILRTGGDFLWELYLERTKEKIILRKFYTEKRKYSLKEKNIFVLTKWTLKNSSALVFSTDWQRKIWQKPYDLDLQKTHIIENFYGGKFLSKIPIKKNFIAGTRKLRWKNVDVLTKAFSEAQKDNEELILDLENLPYDKFLEKLKSCYAIILVSLGDISPNFILDSIRFNKPFILTKENGITGRIKDCAIFVDPLNIKEIKEKILFLSNSENYELQKKKIENFSFNHSWQNIAEEFIDVYQKI